MKEELLRRLEQSGGAINIKSNKDSELFYWADGNVELIRELGYETIFLMGMFSHTIAVYKI